jgi:hypothetical protein
MFCADCGEPIAGFIENHKCKGSIMTVRGNHPLAEVIAKKLSGIEMCPVTEQIMMAGRACKAAVAWHKEEVEALEARITELEVLAERIIDWSEAYPTSVFTDLTEDEIEGITYYQGVSMERLSAHVLRRFTKPWGDRARSIMKESKDV